MCVDLNLKKCLEKHTLKKLFTQTKCVDLHLKKCLHKQILENKVCISTHFKECLFVDLHSE